METLWAPWRLEFIEGKKPEECVFCTLPAAQTDPKNLILWRGPQTYVIMNRYPYTNGHLMVVPHQHSDSVHLLTPDTQAEMMWATGECVRILRGSLGAQAANCGLNLGPDAGAGIIGHLHMHVVPRWRGDCNFMPMIAHTRSMPEYLATTYERLSPAFQQLKK
jgi:ATP adenylyltransferase